MITIVCRCGEFYDYALRFMLFLFIRIWILRITRISASKAVIIRFMLNFQVPSGIFIHKFSHIYRFRLGHTGIIVLYHDIIRIIRIILIPECYFLRQIKHKRQLRMVDRTGIAQTVCLVQYLRTIPQYIAVLQRLISFRIRRGKRRFLLSFTPYVVLAIHHAFFCFRKAHCIVSNQTRRPGIHPGSVVQADICNLLFFIFCIRMRICLAAIEVLLLLRKHQRIPYICGIIFHIKAVCFRICPSAVKKRSVTICTICGLI